LQLTDRSLVWNTDLTEACELDNLLTNAAITVHSAEARKVTCSELPLRVAPKGSLAAL